MTVHILRRAFRVDSFDDLKSTQKESLDAERAGGRKRRLYRRMRSTPTRSEMRPATKLPSMKASDITMK